MQGGVREMQSRVSDEGEAGDVKQCARTRVDQDFPLYWADTINRDAVCVDDDVGERWTAELTPAQISAEYWRLVEAANHITPLLTCTMYTVDHTNTDTSMYWMIHTCAHVMWMWDMCDDADV